MKTFLNRILMILALMSLSIVAMDAQEMVKSYYQQEVRGGGQVPIAPQNLATYVEWYDNGIIKMMDGTVWRFRNQSWDGIRHYTFVKSTGIVMPNTQYIEAMFTEDYSAMQVISVFGMMGRYIQMYKIYRYLGDGSQPAFDWMSNSE